ALVDEIAQFRRGLRIVFLDRLQKMIPSLLVDRHFASFGDSGRGEPPGHKPIHSGPEIINIGPLVDDSASGLLRSHGFGSPLNAAAWLSLDARQAVVKNLDVAGPAHHYVVRF